MKMKCTKCQLENPVGMKFCGQCGARLETICPECNFSNPPEFKFCGECGHDLAVTTQAPPVELSFEEKLENIQRYLPGGLTEKILAQRGKIEGERKQVTVMFCDTEGFTVLSEKLGPEKVYSIMDEVFEMLIHKVNEFGGTVNKMTGDGVMALFGAPIALEDAPQRAIRSALSIQREISRFSDRTKEETGAPLRMRIGIHTGPVVVGTLGNDLRVEFTAVGDTVNLASRMEGLAEPGTVYVTNETFKLTEGLFRFEALGERPFSIMGEAGVGKSRLLYEFRKAIENEDVTFIEGRCLSYSTNVAYHPIIDLLKSTYEIHEGDDDDRIKEKVKRGLKEQGVDEASTLPFVLELLSVKESGIDALNLSPEARKDKTLDALRRIVLKGSEIRPLVVAVEDLHWVDKSSEEAFKDMLDAISGAQLLLIFTYRPEFVHTWGGKSYHNQINLNRLSNRETLAMASHILGTEVMGEDLEELILNKTEGIPFFVEEFMKSLKDLGMIEWRDRGYYLAKDIQEVEIPSTIQEVIMARVDSLPDGAKSVLQIGSAIGREFSCELIKRVTGIPTQEMTPHLSVLRDSELLYERGIFPQATYIFRHSLTQEVAYESLLQKKKQEIHERIGQAIEELHSDRIEEFCEMLAYHYSRSENLEKAYLYLKQSGGKATLNYSYQSSLLFYREAINVLGKLPETEKNKRRGIEVRLSMELPITLSPDKREVFNVMHEGERLAKDIGDEKSLARFYAIIGVQHIIQGDGLLGLKYVESAFQEGEKIEDVEFLASIGFNLFASYIETGDFFKVAEVAPNVIDLLEKMHKEKEYTSGPFNFYSTLCAGCGYAMGMLGRFEEGEVLCEKGLRSALQLNHLLSLGWAEFMYGWLFIAKGDGENTLQHLQESVRYLEETGFIALLGHAWSGLGWGYYFTGELEAALEHMEKGLNIQSDAGFIHQLSRYHYSLSMVHLDMGNLERAQSCIEGAADVAHDNNEKHIEADSRITLGRVLGKMGKSEGVKAEKSILQGIKILDELKLRPSSSLGSLFLGELYADTDQKEKALETLKKAEGAFQEMGMDYWLRRTQDVLERVEG